MITATYMMAMFCWEIQNVMQMVICLTAWITSYSIAMSSIKYDLKDRLCNMFLPLTCLLSLPTSNLWLLVDLVHKDLCTGAMEKIFQKSCQCPLAVIFMIWIRLEILIKCYLGYIRIFSCVDCTGRSILVELDGSDFWIIIKLMKLF